MKPSRTFAIVAMLMVALMACTLASAATVTGVVRNGTIGKPAAGSEVVLLTLSQGGMDEEARTKTDARGRFTFSIADEQESRLVRVTHQGVTYHKMASLEGKQTEVRVYDVARELELTGVMHVQRFQVEGDRLKVTEVVTVRNASNPPRTLINERALQVQLPADANIDSGMVQAAGARPLKHAPIRGDQPGQFYFSFPLRPGETRFAIVYGLPYHGEAVIEPKILYPLERFAVVLPGSLKFEPMNREIFQPRASKTGENVQVTAAMQPGQRLNFRVFGGATPEGSQSRPQQAQSSPAPRSGNGRGARSEKTDPAPNHHWWILGGLAVLIITGGVYTRVAARAARVFKASDCKPAPTDSNAGLEALKKKLLQLEIRRQDGRISPEQYAREKAAFQCALLRATAAAGRTE